MRAQRWVLAHIRLGATNKSAKQIFTQVKSKFGKLFPPLYSNDGRNSNVKLKNIGQELSLSVLGLYGIKGISGSVEITGISSTSFSFRPLPDHPDYSGKITFSFLKLSGNAYLDVSAVSMANIPVGADLDRYAVVGRALWWTFGQNIKSGVLN